jgi:hypothetical protein
LPDYQFSLFGGARVTGPDKEDLPLGRKQARALALLMLSPRSAVASDILIDFLWSEKLPANPMNSLQDLIKRLRALLGDSDHSTIVTRSGGYGLFVPPDALDIEVFRRLAGAGLKLEQAEPMAAKLLLERAMENALGDLPDIAPDFRASERIDDLYHLRFLVTQALCRIELAADCGPGLSDEAFAIWSIGGSPVGMALDIAELGELALADLVGIVTRHGGRLHQVSRGMLLASFAAGDSALRAAAGLIESSDLPEGSVRSGAVRHFHSIGPVNDVDRLLELAEMAKSGQILVSDDVYQSAASGRLKDRLLPFDADHWVLSGGDAGQRGGPEHKEAFPEPCCGPNLLGLSETGPPRMYWGRTVQMARAVEGIVSGLQNLRPE